MLARQSRLASFTHRQMPKIRRELSSIVYQESRLQQSAPVSHQRRLRQIRRKNSLTEFRAAGQLVAERVGPGTTSITTDTTQEFIDRVSAARPFIVQRSESQPGAPGAR
ncbi:protein of unknown function [Methylocella tundrae]|uniref:Uncharacterized protein n=1 Tax=Methylocella tundrae TaxID=227605 RepID=A0A4V6IMI9_METTU|nr:protein of unknown function [Methylocella tundrae]